VKIRILDIVVLTDAGDKKKNNENGVLAKTAYVKSKTKRGEEIGIFAVAEGPRKASALTIEMLSFWWTRYFLPMMKNAFLVVEILDHLDKSIELMNMQIIESAPDLRVSLSIVIIIGNVFIARHIGVAKLLLINKRITRISKDNNERLGERPNVGIFKKADKIVPNDVFLLCTSGFAEAALPTDILKVIFNSELYAMQEKANKLREEIPRGAALENISLIFIRQLRESEIQCI
jgi:serine/threonine protein phosphatase PrpC